MSVQDIQTTTIRRRGPIDDVAVDMGKRLRALRLKKDISQEGLAASLGVTFQQIQKYEKGIDRIHYGRLQRICKVLRVNWSYFLDPMDAAEIYTRDIFQNRTTIELVDAFNRITDSTARRALVTLAEKLASE